MFLPLTQKEALALGWERLDVILVTGDAYIDSPYIGVAVIGKVLADAGFRVGIIAQPDVSCDCDISRFGEPELFWGVTSGCMDSMIANYTATKKRRKSDDLTAGGINNRRPDRAVITYTNLIRRYCRTKKPIVLGGIEASLRRISHYDYWSNRVRRSILFDAKADILVYGMGERAVVELAEHLKAKQPVTGLRGTCHIAKQAPEGWIKLPSHAEAAADKDIFTKMFNIFYANTDPVTAKGLCQLQDTRYLIVNPPQPPLNTAELDHVHELDFERGAHPVYVDKGPIRALDTIRFSLSTHRGCYGECNFCSITAHQGRIVTSRSEASILSEVEKIVAHPGFSGIIADAGGPTANMYGFECARKLKQGACAGKRCLTPEPCRHLPVSHLAQIRLLGKIAGISGVKKVFVASGIRHDLVMTDKKHGRRYLETICKNHVSGQLKTAPEHTDPFILELLGKPGAGAFKQFASLYETINRHSGKNQYLTCYFIAAHPGCDMSHMKALKRFVSSVLRFTPEQVQIFTPSPLTISTLMYYTQKTEDGRPVFVEKDMHKKEAQKMVITGRRKKQKKPPVRCRRAHKIDS
ncbi:MAG: YgiQ family radical SAM protein [Deltaproteobacteria bacterium]|nr:YgiQ family radical SAM protein [Deltaproteobacteria bacterium]